MSLQTSKKKRQWSKKNKKTKTTKKTEQNITKRKEIIKENNKIEQKTNNNYFPKYSTRIHLPKLAGSFCFRKNGKLRLDKSLKYFCIENKCIGVFVVNIHLIRINVKHILYNVNKKGIYINTINDQKKINLFIPFPNGITIKLLKNPEAKYYQNKYLICKIPILDYNSKIITNTKNKV